MPTDVAAVGRVRDEQRLTCTCTASALPPRAGAGPSVPAAMGRGGATERPPRHVIVHGERRRGAGGRRGSGARRSGRKQVIEIRCIFPSRRCPLEIVGEIKKCVLEAIITQDHHASRSLPASLHAPPKTVPRDEPQRLGQRWGAAYKCFFRDLNARRAHVAAVWSPSPSMAPLSSPVSVRGHALRYKWRRTSAWPMTPIGLCASARASSTAIHRTRKSLAARRARSCPCLYLEARAGACPEHRGRRAARADGDGKAGTARLAKGTSRTLRYGPPSVDAEAAHTSSRSRSMQTCAHAARDRAPRPVRRSGSRRQAEARMCELGTPPDASSPERRRRRLAPRVARRRSSRGDASLSPPRLASRPPYSLQRRATYGRRCAGSFRRDWPARRRTCSFASRAEASSRRSARARARPRAAASCATS